MEEPGSVSKDYHAVYVPLSLDYPDYNGTELHVYDNKLEALKVIKKYKKGRLKTFKTYEEAKEFSKNGLESILINPLSNSVPTIIATEEKSSNFKAPKPQNLTQFRKLIEKNDLESVRTTIWENPRYLVSSGDTPAILHEGSRYNALHVAVKVAQDPEMCKTILDTLGDPDFVKLFYGDAEENKTYIDRASILQDLYLNTPDKGLNETPLHFATKFGLKECVKVLLSYPQCKKNPLNKYKQTPGDIICTRKSMDNTTLINEIRSLLFDELFFVPVLRAEDNSLQPIIGEPFSPASPPRFNDSPLSPRIEVRAIAGPMSKNQAIEFRKKWKTPPRILGTPIKKCSISEDCNGFKSPGLNSSFRNSSMNSPFRSPRSVNTTFNFQDSDCFNASFHRLQDTDKGLERVGRELALEYQVPWKEYWPFFQDFADLRDEEGLKKLEVYLKHQFQIKSNVLALEKSFNHLLEMSQKTEEKVDDLCTQLETLALQTESDSDNEDKDNTEFETPPTSPSIQRKNNKNSRESDDDDEMDLADDSIHEEMFIQGKTPSKVDFAVLAALPAEIDENKFPCIYLWRHEMHLASKNLNGVHFYMSSPKAPSLKRRLFLSN